MFLLLIFELRSTPLLSLLNVEVLPLSLSTSSLLLSTMIKIKIRPLKKKKEEKLLHSSTYHYETQIWIRSLIALGCFWGGEWGLQFLACYFWDSTLSIYKRSYLLSFSIVSVLQFAIFSPNVDIFLCITSIKIISFEFCHCFCSLVCNILTKRG